MREMPEAYRGREQTWLKHRVLQEYLTAWSHKLGSVQGREVHLWYVDAFAGPWQSSHQERADTSIAIGLGALDQAARTWAAMGRTVGLHAVFVEKNPTSYAALRAFVDIARGGVDVHVLRGEFGAHVDAIDRLIGRDPAFIFVDPTGWDGAALRFIARLGRPSRRDVLVNVMYDHINRFKDDEREFLRAQMRDFFGLTSRDLAVGLSEDELMAFYRAQLKQLGELPYVADLAVPVPDRNRTKFRLVVAGHHPRVLEVFRDAEARVIGVEAARVRADARERNREQRTGQLEMLRPVDSARDAPYAGQHRNDESELRAVLPSRLAGRPQAFGALWPHLLESYHLTLGDLRRVVLAMERDGLLVVRGRGPRERTVKDQHVLAVPEHPSG